ncbi:MAG: anaerobic ribonucleoside-triphosphate reductase activating protein [Clostridia bacterium]|nr:anaerobic ribonucleoside-triphosphate reductase activating protein [Clostridia bacterium]
MLIHGLQKLTLLDFPGRVAATLFTGGCNFRCPFCHNATLVEHPAEAPTYSEEEIFSFLTGRKGILDGVAITGGEPLMNPDIRDFIKKIKEMGFAVKLDTNGAYPKRLSELLDENLVDYVAMDVKNSREKYAETVGLAKFDLTPIEESVQILLSSGIDFEFRTTVVKEFHTVEDIAKIADWIAGAEHYFLQGFTDSGNLIGSNLHPYEKAVMQEMEAVAREKIPDAKLRGIS